MSIQIFRSWKLMAFEIHSFDWICICIFGCYCCMSFVETDYAMYNPNPYICCRYFTINKINLKIDWCKWPIEEEKIIPWHSHEKDFFVYANFLCSMSDRNGKKFVEKVVKACLFHRYQIQSIKYKYSMFVCNTLCFAQDQDKGLAGELINIQTHSCWKNKIDQHNVSTLFVASRFQCTHLRFIHFSLCNRLLLRCLSRTK